MRSEFMRMLHAAAKSGRQIGLVVGDLGYGVVEEFAIEYPNLFLNSGVAEQSMIGIAAGMTSQIDRVFVYSIGNFPTIRCLEQIRNIVCYHNKNVTIVAIGAGLAYGTLGYTHHAVEDIAVMRVMPNMTIYSPADPKDVSIAMEEIFASNGPSYLRLSKTGESELLRIKKSTSAAGYELLVDGDGPLIITTGLITKEVLKASQLLREENVNVAVVKFNKLNFESGDFVDFVQRYSQIFVVEEHSVTGGFGSMVLEFNSKNSICTPTSLIGIVDPWKTPVGSDVFLRQHFKIDAIGIAKQITEKLRS